MKKTLTFDAAYYDKENFLYFSAANINGIFRIDIRGCTVEFLLSVKEYYKDAPRLFGTVIRRENYLVFAPETASDILVYNMADKEYKLFHVAEREGIECNDPFFFYMCNLDDDFYLFPLVYPEIVHFNLRSENIEYIPHHCKDMKDSTKRQGFFRHALRREKDVLVPLSMENKLMIFEPESNRINIKDVVSKNTQEGLCAICFDGEFYWIQSLKSEYIYRYNLESNDVSKIKLPNKNEEGEYTYLDCICWKNYILIAPYMHNDLVAINKNNREIVSITIPGFSESTANYITALIGVDDESVFICTEVSECYYKISMINGKFKIERYELNLENAIKQWSRCKGICKNVPPNEDNIWGLELFLETIK